VPSDQERPKRCSSLSSPKLDRLLIVRRNPDCRVWLPSLNRDPHQTEWFGIKQFKRPEISNSDPWLAGGQVNKWQDGRAPRLASFLRTVSWRESCCAPKGGGESQSQFMVSCCAPKGRGMGPQEMAANDISCYSRPGPAPPLFPKPCPCPTPVRPGPTTLCTRRG